MPKSKIAIRRASARSPDTWPIIWRVVAPGAGNYGHDMVFIETDDEEAARQEYVGLRRTQWPVRLEQVRCGPLPGGAEGSLRKIHDAGLQNSGETLRPVVGAWTDT